MRYWHACNWESGLDYVSICLVNCTVNVWLRYVASNGLHQNRLENGWLEKYISNLSENTLILFRNQFSSKIFVLRVKAGLGKYTLHIVLYGELRLGKYTLCIV